MSTTVQPDKFLTTAMVVYRVSWGVLLSFQWVCYPSVNYCEQSDLFSYSNDTLQINYLWDTMMVFEVFSVQEYPTSCSEGKLR